MKLTVVQSNTMDGPAGPTTLSITEKAISRDKSQGAWMSAFGGKADIDWRCRDVCF
jgi:hypothetical protein